MTRMLPRTVPRDAPAERIPRIRSTGRRLHVQPAAESGSRGDKSLGPQQGVHPVGGRPVSSDLVIAPVAPFPRLTPRVPRREVSADLEPAIVRHFVIRGVQRAAFPFIDSRTRYWRYFLFLHPTFRSDRVIGKRLHRVLRDNPGRRGVGRRIVDTSTAAISRSTRLRLTRLLRRDYGSAASRLWNDPGAVRSRSLRSCARSLRRGALDEFFGARQDRRAMAEFRNLMVAQSDAARCFSRRWRMGMSTSAVVLACTRLRSVPADLRQLMLGWAVLRTTFRWSDRAKAFGSEDTEEADDWQVEDEPTLRSLARWVIRELRHPTSVGLPTRSAGMIIRLLQRSLAAEPFRAPVPVSVPVQKTRVSVFSDLRLSAFRRLLEGTWK